MISKDKVREFEPLFHPKSIAVVGASRDTTKPGFTFFRNLHESGYKGKLYPINPSGDEMLGIKSYPSIRDIPDDTVEYVIGAIPKRFMLDLLDDCASKGVKFLQIFTAGFSEVGEEEGRNLEQAMVDKARRLGIRILGPNCAGITSPGNPANFALRPLLITEGEVGFISQSGGNAGTLQEMSALRGIRLSKLIAYGNGCDLDSMDFLEYLAVDPETRIIGMYAEGVRDGTRLMELIRETSMSKPVIFWKGGKTEAGAGAALSHTGSLAGSSAVWSGVLRQAGAIEVETVEEMADTLLAFQSISPFRGNRAAVIAGLAAAGGGASVALGDACEFQGLHVPPISSRARKALRSFLAVEGRIFRNPIDISQAGFDPENMTRILEIVLGEEHIDVVIIHIDARVFLGNSPKERLIEIADVLIDCKNRQNKPIVTVFNPSLHHAVVSEVEHRLAAADVPSYPSFGRAAKAIVNVSKHWSSQ